MNIAQRFRRLVLALALLAICTYGLAEGRFAVAFVLALLATAGWWVTESKIGRGLPRWIVGLVLVLIVARTAIEALTGEFSISPFSLFLASVIVVKLWEQRQLRDYAQILSISLFLNIGSILNSNTFAVGLLLVASVPMFVYAVMLMQVFAGHARATLARGGVSEVIPALTVPRRARSQLALVTVVSLVMGLGLSIGVFVILPRDVGRDAFGNFARPAVGRVNGFTDYVQLGTSGLISESESVVMNVQVEASPGVYERALPSRHLYLRGAVLDFYDKGVWQRSARAPTNHTDGAVGVTINIGPPVPGDDILLHVQYRGSASDQQRTPIFTTLRPQTITMQDGPGRLIFYDGTREVFREGPRSAIEYQLTCILPAFVPDAAWTRKPVEFDSPRLHSLAERLARGSGLEPDPDRRSVDDDARLTRLFETYLRDSCSYTLDVVAPTPGREPIEWFVFEQRSGNCEYFASALAAMCRTVGIEARVVAGYYAGEDEEGAGRYTVRQSNAHAWVEARVGPNRWQVYDATPPSNLAQITTPKTGLFASLGRLLDEVEDLWSSNVVNFDEQSRDTLLGGQERWFDRVRPGMGKRFTWRNVAMPRVQDPLLVAVVAAAGLVGAAWGWRAWRRSRLARAADLRSRTLTGEAGALYRDLEQALVRHGHVRPAWQSPLAHVQAITSSDVPLGERATMIVATCYKHWFGGERVGEAELARAERALAEIENGSAWGVRGATSRAG